MCDAIECHKMPFEPIFSPVERTKLKNGIVIGYLQNKRSDGLKNAFCSLLLNFCL